VVAAVVQYIPADIYILALQILLRANRSSPVFFSLRVFVYLARAVFYPSFNLFFFFCTLFPGLSFVALVRFLFRAPLWHTRSRRETKKKNPFCGRNRRGNDKTLLREILRVRGPLARTVSNYSSSSSAPKGRETTAKKDKKKKKVKTLNV
jgi:hypothetical protein